MNVDLCLDFLVHANWVWRDIADAEQYGFPFGEETITETILLNLKRRHPHKLLIQPFTKRQERWNGADWEWWIGRDGNWIGMRVQAKRISLPDETYKSIFYQSKNAAQMQIEYLIEQAQAASPPLIPIYTLYTHSSDISALQARTQHCDVMVQPRPQQYGCLVAHAKHVQAEGSIKLSNIAPHAFPWHCLVCQCLSQANDPSRPADYITKLFRGLGDALDGARDDRLEVLIPDPVEQLPDHIQLMRSGDDRGGEKLSEYGRRWDIGGLMLIDLSDENE